MSSLISHVEIPVKDLEASKKFYEDLFGWEFKPFGNGYLLYNNHKGITVGLRKSDNIKAGDTTIFHITVSSIDMILERIKDAGGKVERNKTIIPVMGWYALIKDNSDNIIGLYQQH
ncbi:MAG TPA: VOC family protein [Ignavibacteriaceae bacterium]|nr:VOC family protein [Ignavibacteriaceae bacterium]